MKDFLYSAFIFIRDLGVYIYRISLWGIDTIYSQWWLARALKGGYFVIRDDRRRQLYRGDLVVGWFNITSLEDDEMRQDLAAYDVEFFTKSRKLVYRTKI
jgi:hypothetical protein